MNLETEVPRSVFNPVRTWSRRQAAKTNSTGSPASALYTKASTGTRPRDFSDYSLAKELGQSCDHPNQPTAAFHRLGRHLRRIVRDGEAE